MTPRLSVVLPVYGNASTLEELHDRLSTTLRAMPVADFEMVFVDDASPDGSWQLIEALAASDPRVVGIRLQSNVGQLRALCAGLEAARGEVFSTMDADLEHPPEALPRLVEAFRDGHEFVVGQRIGHSSTRVRLLGSLALNRLSRALGLPRIGVGSSFLVGTPRIAGVMRRIVERTGRQMILPTVFDAAHDPAVVELDLSTRSDSAYSMRGVARLGGEFAAAELAPRLAPRLLLCSAVALVLAAHRPWRARALRCSVALAAIGAVGLLAPVTFRRDDTEPLYEVAARVGVGLDL